MARNAPIRALGGRSFVSLFSGCGGLDLGFTQAGFRCSVAIDLDPKALAVHKSNISGNTLVCDLSQEAFPLQLESPPDLVLSGSPCQGFSTIGKMQPNDIRNQLLLRGATIAVAMRARVFVAENVPAVAFSSHKKYWDELGLFLRNSGYSCSSLTLLASDYGVAQMRKRLFLVAVRGPHTLKLLPQKAAKVILKDAIGDLCVPKPDLQNHDPQALSLSSTDLAIAKRIGQGQKLCNVRGGDRSIHTWDIPEVFGKTTVRERRVLNELLRLRRRERVRENGDADPVELPSLQSHLTWNPDCEIQSLILKGYLRQIGECIDIAHTFNGKYRRLSWLGVSHTVDTRFGSARNFLHPELHRAFTVREAARIQGFPDSFSISGSIHDQFRMVGNAVPPPVAKSIAIELAKFLEN